MVSGGRREQSRRHIWVYLLAELVGGAVAAGAFRLTQPAEKADGQVRAVQSDSEIGRPGDATPRGVSPTAT